MRSNEAIVSCLSANLENLFIGRLDGFDLRMVRRELPRHDIEMLGVCLADPRALEAEPGKILLKRVSGILYHHIEVYPEGPAVRQGPLKFGWFPPPPMPSQASISQNTTAFREMASV